MLNRKKIKQERKESHKKYMEFQKRELKKTFNEIPYDSSWDYVYYMINYKQRINPDSSNT